MQKGIIYPSVALLTLVSTVGIASTNGSAELDKSITKILECSRGKDIYCVSKYLVDPDTIYVSTKNDSRKLYPNLENDAFSDGKTLNLFKAASYTGVYSYKVFFASKRHAEVIFYRVDIEGTTDFISLNLISDHLQCGFVKIRNKWKMTNSLCGILDSE